MKTFTFNRKDYNSYKDMYKDLAIKLDRIKGLEDYYDISNYDFNSHCLEEDLMYGFEDGSENTFIFLNFDRENIKKIKNVEDYEYDLIFQVFERYIKENPNNKLEFKMEEDKK